MITTVLIWGALAPAAITAALLVGALRPWANASTDQAPRTSWAAGPALAAGYVAGHWGMAGAPWAASNDVIHVLVPLAIVGALVGLLEVQPAMPTGLRWLVRVLVSGGAAWLLLRPLAVAHGGPPTQIAAQVGVVAAAIVLVWAMLEAAASRETGPSLAFSLLVLIGGGSLTLLFSGTATTAQIGGVLIAAVGGTFVVLWRWPILGALRSAAPAIAMVLVGQWTIGWGYAEMPTPSFLLLVTAPVALLVSWLPRARQLPRLAATGLRLLVLAIPLGAAIAISAITYFGDGAPPSTTAPGTQSSGGGDDYGY